VIRRNPHDGWNWTDGALALQPLQLEEDCDTVPSDMPSSRPTRRRRVERREVRSARRTRRFALLTLLAIVLLIALGLTAFGGSTQRLQRLAVTNLATGAATSPFPQIIALRGPVRLQMPIPQARQTAIGYHAANDGALALSPVGHQGNEGLVQRVFHRVFGGGGGHPVWYRLGGGPTSTIDVGAAPGTDVYSPVDGVVVGITPYVVAGHRYGSRIDIQPQSAPSLVVTLTQLRADPALTVGADVVSGATKVGAVVDLSKVERQALARYTNDAGNHVSIELHTAAVLVLS
jgi:murein DD-endopeptidase MepM/ murein hydrolase activator NlpD